MKLVLRSGILRLDCCQCGAEDLDAAVYFDGDFICYACLSAACGLLGGALLEAEEKAAEREVLDAPIGEYP